MVTIVQAVTDEQIRQVQALFTEYFEFIRTDVDAYLTDPDAAPPMTGFREELAGLPGKYAPPDGRLLLALAEGEPAGCVALCKFSEGIGELKRLWARPQFRGRKIGRALVEAAIVEARQMSCTTLILSTVVVLKEAQSLYQTLGFERTEPYFDGPPEMMAREVFMKLDLTR